MATLILAWSGVYLYVSLYYGLLWLRRRRDREYLTFSLLTLGLALYSLSEVMLEGAVTTYEVLSATRLGAVGLLTVVPFLVDFTSSLTGHQTRLTFLTYLWSALGLVFVGAGLFFDPELTARSPWFVLIERTALPPTGTTLLANLWLGTGVLIAGSAMATMMRSKGASGGYGVSKRRDYRLIILSLGLAVLAGAHDALARSGHIVSIGLLVHVAVLFIAMMTYVLLDRFVAANRALTRRTVELRSAYEELQKTQRELVRKEQLAAVGELSAVIAHEVRNPLAVIRNAGAGLRRDQLASDDRLTLLDILDEECDRLSRLVHDLLAYASPVTPHGAELDLGRLIKRSVERALAGLRASDETPEVDIRYELSGERALFGDAELLRHAFVNIVENAIQSMPEGGSLEIRTEPVDLHGSNATAISFADSGEGMQPQTRSKATHPFFTTRPSGTGLGLAIVERVVQNHGGSMSIESVVASEGEASGTTVVMTLPVKSDALAVPEGAKGLSAVPGSGQ